MMTRTFNAAQCALALIFLACSTPLFASVLTPVNTDTGIVIRKSPTNVTSADMLSVEAPNAYGISVNHFNEFRVEGNKLRIFHNKLGTDQYSPAKLIVISANTLSLYDEIELVGESADLLLVTPNSSVNSSVVCHSCKFRNFARVTLAAANNTNYLSSTMTSVGTLSTFSGGSLDINHLDASGALSLELLAENITTQGTITTNLKAIQSSDGSYVVSENGDLVAGSGGINIYTGSTALDYEKLKSSNHATNTDTTQAELSGEFLSAAISLISAKPLRINSSAILSTKSDMLVSSSHQGNFIAAVEGIFIQTHTENHADLTINGQLLSDNKIQISSLDKLTLNGELKAGVVFLADRDGTINTGLIEGDIVESGSGYFINEGNILAQQALIEAVGSIYNQFGGRISGNNVTLISTESSVINGSRSDKTYNPADLPPLLMEAYIPADHKYGIYEDVANFGTGLRTNLSATISANNLKIRSERFENINPYHLTKGDGVSWIAGVDLDLEKSRQVSVLAEQSLQISASEYLLNASAILGLNQSGQFIINTPTLVNERYRIEATLAEVGHRTFSDVGDQLGVENISGLINTGLQSNVSENNVETYLSAYSPPAVMYSFGDLLFSDGNENNVTDSTFTNKFSILEVFGDTHFHQTDFHSIGLVMAARPALGYEIVRCAAYGCDAAEYISLIEYETLSSFAGKVYGLNTDVIISTINELDDAYPRAIIDPYVEAFRIHVETSSDYNGIYYGYSIPLRISSYISGWRVVPSANGNELIITTVRCQEVLYDRARVEYDAGEAAGINGQCNNLANILNLDDIINSEAGEAIVDGTTYTAIELKEKSIEYLSTLDERGVLEDISGYYRRQYRSWSLSDDYSSVRIAFNTEFDPDEYPPLTATQHYVVGYQNRSHGHVTVDLAQLMQVIVPVAPSNLRLVDSGVNAAGDAFANLTWDSIAQEHITYRIYDVEAELEISKNDTLVHAATWNGNGSTLRHFRVSACNGAYCGSWSEVLAVPVFIPPTQADLINCNGQFYEAFTDQYRVTPTTTNANGLYGHHCAIKTVDNIEYFLLLQVQHNSSQAGEYLTCIRNQYTLNAMVAYLTPSNVSTLPPSTTLTNIVDQYSLGQPEQGDCALYQANGFTPLTR